MNELDVFRNNHLIDPAMHIWGWEIPVYLFLGGITAGLMVMSALLDGRVPAEERSRWGRWLPFAAPVAISLGMGALFLDLEHKLHVYRFYLAFRPASPMSWGAWILLAIYPATLLFGLAGLTPSERNRVAGLLGRVGLEGAVVSLHGWAVARVSALRKWNLGLGIALGGYTGILLGTLGARALWASPVLGPLFLVSGLSTGAALMMLFPVSHREHHLLRRWDLMAIGVEVVLLGIFFLGLATTGGELGREAAELFFGGPYTAVFWTLVVFAGLLAPVALEVTEGLRGLRPTLVAPALVLVGGLALRFVLVVAGQG